MISSLCNFIYVLKFYRSSLSLDFVKETIMQEKGFWISMAIDWIQDKIYFITYGNKVRSGPMQWEGYEFECTTLLDITTFEYNLIFRDLITDPYSE